MNAGIVRDKLDPNKNLDLMKTRFQGCLNSEKQGQHISKQTLQNSYTTGTGKAYLQKNCFKVNDLPYEKYLSCL